MKERRFWHRLLRIGSVFSVQTLNALLRAMPLDNPNYDTRLSIEDADRVVRHIASGRMCLGCNGDEVMLREADQPTGVRLPLDQLTRREIMKAVAEFHPRVTPPDA